MIYHCNRLAFIILVLFTVPFYYIVLSRYLGLTKRHFSSDILVPFPDLSDFYSCGYTRARNTKIKLWTGTPKTPGNSTWFFRDHPSRFHNWKFHLLFLQYAISESARPFSFLNGVHGKLCKLGFELYRIHAKKIGFCNTFAYVPSTS